MKTGSQNLITDIDGIYVGNSQDDKLKSGVTIVTSDTPFTASIAIMGGAPGTRDTALLEPDKTIDAIDALVLAGGSAYGLDATSGVMEGLKKDRRGLRVKSAIVPIVPTAIIFDLLNGGDKDWEQNPYPELGRAAYENRSKIFNLGSVGAGTGAIAGDVKGGLGSASLDLEDGITVGAIVAVNAIGSPLNGQHFWAAPWEMNGEFGGLGCEEFPALAMPKLPKIEWGQSANTTIAIIATNAGLTKSQCQRIATAAHDGIARAIVPAHTPYDGDLVFALSTAKHEKLINESDILKIGHAASICLARAIARGIYEAKAATSDPMPTAQRRLAKNRG